ncbi:hypothetical protein M3Y99_01296000 [Aphelenchoides fujianensis]|nr:hypothetical protein M3Y99_01296000 [Aphelenchoides fujianensis]
MAKGRKRRFSIERLAWSTSAVSAAPFNRERPEGNQPPGYDSMTAVERMLYGQQNLVHTFGTSRLVWPRGCPRPCLQQEVEDLLSVRWICPSKGTSEGLSPIVPPMRGDRAVSGDLFPFSSQFLLLIPEPNEDDRMVQFDLAKNRLSEVSGGRLEKSADYSLLMETDDAEDDQRNNRSCRCSQSEEPEGFGQRSQTKRPRNSPSGSNERQTENADPRILPPSAKRLREEEEDGGMANLSTELISTVSTTAIRGRTPSRIAGRAAGKKRSLSASRVLDEKPNNVRRQLLPRSPYLCGIHNNDIRKTPTAGPSSWTGGRPIESCAHSFVPLKGSRFFSLIGRTPCSYCNLSISNTPGVSCKDCRVAVHESCRSNAPMPCLPIADFPTEALNTKGKMNLAALCPVRPPFIPALILRCVHSLERKAEDSESCYAPAENEKAINSLFADFMRKQGGAGTLAALDSRRPAGAS